MKKKIIFLILGICLIIAVISGFIIKQKEGTKEELTVSYLNDLESEKTRIIMNYLEEQDVKADVLWSRMIIQNNSVYLLYEFTPIGEEQARRICSDPELNPEDYDYMGYLRIERTFKEDPIKYYKVVEWKETFCSEESAVTENHGLSGYTPAEDLDGGYWKNCRWYNGDEFIFFGKVYTDEIAEMEFYDDDSLLKVTYHVGDKGYFFLILQDVRNVTARIYNKEHTLITEWDWTDDWISDPLQDYKNIEKGRVQDWKQ